MMKSSLIAVLLCVLAGFVYWHFFYQGKEYIFPGVVGPVGQSVVPAPVPLSSDVYAAGGDSRMAVLLTDKDSAWIGLAHGLKTIGVPFIITTDWREALKHKVVYVYPNATGRNLSEEALAALAAFPSQGGTLIAQHALARVLSEPLGFVDAVEDTRNKRMHIDPASPVAAGLADPAELTIPVAGKTGERVGLYNFTNPKFPPVATYGDGSAAITRNEAGTGYALGVDIGYLLLRGYNNKQQDIASHYVNAFEPALDVLLRCIRNIYLMGEKDGVTLATVPEGKPLAVLITHDIDYTRSLVNALDYAAYERAHNITATYFMQVKYIRDWNDDMFFTADGVRNLLKLQAYGMEIGSHSIAHSRQYAKFDLGDGMEQYPSYLPFVKSRDLTVGGTVLGELRVSKFLLEHFVPGLTVTSFRPGHLSNPYALPQAMMATGYSYSSSVTANDSITHLPFQLTYNRSDEADSSIFEFPLTIEDEADGPMINRLPQAVGLAKKLERYGAIFNILIHPDILGQKLDFEKGFIDAMHNDGVWYGSVGQMGKWWAARNQVGVDVTRDGDRMDVALTAPQEIRGLALDIPVGATYVSSDPSLKVTQTGNRVLIDDLPGDAHLKFSLTPH